MVYFVGAGTGAADLITVRGMRLIARADVIIYAGSLVNPELLAYAGRETEIYNSAELTLEEVIQIMSDAQEEGKTIVRLHTGDPSIYGAVREQMDELDKRKISYESCPGVSACFGAASSLNLEYTLPGISQSLIITRMEGRTKVPEMESIEHFAAHQSSMAIYLSAGMIDELCRRLLAGGYRKGTPAALVYKATWKDEEAYLCTVSTLPDMAKQHGITKTAIVLVGDAIAHQHYERSRLYAPDFSTEFRQGSDASDFSTEFQRGSDVKKFSAWKKEKTKTWMGLSIISFTEVGRQLSKQIANNLAKEKNVQTVLFARNAAYAGQTEKEGQLPVVSVETSVAVWAKEQMDAGNALLFIGACGIAVRAVASHIKDKLSDVPVLVLDEKGHYVIPILSGHVGGANELAHLLAEKTGAVPVITTATDLNEKFAVDVFAAKNGLHIVNRDGIARVSAKVLAGETVTMSIEPDHCNLKEGMIVKGVQIMSYPPKQPVDVVVTSREDTFDTTILLKPKEYVIGIGCKKGKKEEDISAFIVEKLNEAGILKTQVAACSSISQKQKETGIISWCRKERIPFVTYTTEELQQVRGDFHASEFVRDTVGVDNVCERAALKACETGGVLITEKCAENGMTLAIARREWRVVFDEE